MVVFHTSADLLLPNHSLHSLYYQLMFQTFKPDVTNYSILPDNSSTRLLPNFEYIAFLNNLLRFSTNNSNVINSKQFFS